MKLKTPFPIIKNTSSDMRVMQNSNYVTTPKTREEFWNKKGAQYPNESSDITYEV